MTLFGNAFLSFLLPKKNPASGVFSIIKSNRRSGRNDIDECSVLRAFDSKLYIAVGFCKQGVILATTYVITRVELGATLTHDDVTGYNHFTAEFFDAETL